jgi:hypothetical protein
MAYSGCSGVLANAISSLTKKDIYPVQILITWLLLAGAKKHSVDIFDASLRAARNLILINLVKQLIL